MPRIADPEHVRLAKKKAAGAKWQKSAAGKAWRSRWLKTPAGKAKTHRELYLPGHKASRERWRKSPAGKAWRSRWKKTVKGRVRWCKSTLKKRIGVSPGTIPIELVELIEKQVKIHKTIKSKTTKGLTQ